MLAWQAPDRLEKRTISPIEECCGSRAADWTYARPDRGIHREFGLDEQPEMRALVEAIRGTLAGDAAALRRYYEIGFDGTAEVPGAGVVPLSLRVRAAVQRIRLAGRGAQVLEVETEGNGGVTRMRITPQP